MKLISTLFVVSMGLTSLAAQAQVQVQVQPLAQPQPKPQPQVDAQAQPQSLLFRRVPRGGADAGGMPDWVDGCLDADDTGACFRGQRGGRPVVAR